MVSVFRVNVYWSGSSVLRSVVPASTALPRPLPFPLATCPAPLDSLLVSTFAIVQSLQKDVG